MLEAERQRRSGNLAIVGFPFSRQNWGFAKCQFCQFKGKKKVKRVSTFFGGSKKRWKRC